MKKIVAILLIILGVFMLFFGFSKSMLPPGITGIGFIAIALFFLRE